MKKFIRMLFISFYEKIRLVGEKQRAKKFKRYGLELIKSFDDCMKQNNWFYTLAFGSMLGAIREKGFIKHDNDVDVWMWIEDDNENLLTQLNKYGFSLYRTLEVDNGRLGKEYTLIYKKMESLRIDIFFVYPAVNKLPYSIATYRFKCGQLTIDIPKRDEVPLKKESKTVKFETIKLPIPVNAEELCAILYGEDYMIPNHKAGWGWLPNKDIQVLGFWWEKASIIS